MSSLLFNVHLEIIFKEALEDTDAGIKVNGECINNIRYADDTVVLADSLEELPGLLVSRKQSGIRVVLNIKNTKYLVIFKNKIQTEGLNEQRRY